MFPYVTNTPDSIYKKIYPTAAIPTYIFIIFLNSPLLYDVPINKAVIIANIAKNNGFIIYV